MHHRRYHVANNVRCVVLNKTALVSRSFLPLFGREAHFVYLRYLVVLYFALFYYCAKGWGNSKSRFKSVYGSIAYYLFHLAIQLIVPLGIVYWPEDVSVACTALNEVMQKVVPQVACTALNEAIQMVPAGVAYNPGSVPIASEIANAMMLYFMLKSDALLGTRLKKKRDSKHDMPLSIDWCGIMSGIRPS